MSNAIDGVISFTGPAAGRRLVYGLIAAFIATLTFATAVPPAAAQQAAPTEFSEEELEAFAAAAQKIDELRDKWQPQVAEARTAEESRQMRQQAIEEMMAAVRDEGLTVDQYDQIVDAAQEDPAVMQQIQEHLQSSQ